MSKPDCFESNPNPQQIAENCCNDCPSRKKCFEVPDKKQTPDKEQVTEADLIMLEAALNLKALSNFEKGILEHLKLLFKMNGLQMVITEAQRHILEQLHERYKKAHSTKQDTIAALHYYYEDGE